MVSTVILAILIGGALFFYMFYKHCKLVSDGKVIDRDRNFVEKVEDFILTMEASAHQQQMGGCI